MYGYPPAPRGRHPWPFVWAVALCLLSAFGIAMRAAHERTLAARANRAVALSRAASLLRDLFRVQREQRRYQLQLELARQPVFWTKDVERALASLELPFGSLRAQELERVSRTLARAQVVSADRTRVRIEALLEGVPDDDGAIAFAIWIGVAREEQLELRQKLIALLRSGSPGMSARRRSWAIEQLSRRIVCWRGECCWFALDIDSGPV